MIKGHAKIELTNAKTGEKQVIEEDNLVTNALKYYMNPLYHGNMSTLNVVKLNNNNTYETSLDACEIDKWFGGLLLFHDTIEEDADNCLIPTDNQMIGNARVNYASASGVPEFGAYNSEESSLTFEDGKVTRKYVYDFTTSKGNGTISCVALTNFIAGYMGIGNTSGVNENIAIPPCDFSNKTYNQWSFWDKTKLNYRQSFLKIKNNLKPAQYNTSSYKDVILFTDFVNDAIYYIDMFNLRYNSSYKSYHFTSTGKLRIYKQNVKNKTYNPFTHFTSYSTQESGYKFDLITECIELDVPSELKTYNSSIQYDNIGINCVENGSWIIFYNNSIKSFMCWFIGTDLKTTKFITVKNTTGDSLSLSNMIYTTAELSYTIYNNYLIVYNNSKVYAININDNTDVFELVNNYKNRARYYNLYMFNSQLFVIDNNYCLYACDLKNKCLKPLNGQLTHNVSSYPYAYYNLLQSLNGSKVGLMNYNGYYNEYKLSANPFTLSTINNLSEPVTKTNDMTMKITYTLTSDL